MGDSRILRILRKSIEPLVHAAEVLFGSGNGSQKRQWVIDALNSKIDIPFLSENVEERIIGLIVDIVCDILNERGVLDQISGTVFNGKVSEK